ncbi:tetratricopeptide repeat protein [Niveibacterium sp. SC-1]|uniref:tetratricopeptide repeat protein n=1 Tax=Niveibacterium sp. SC-1 TaxID=3135646 RepID=UPI00311DE4A3
MPPPAERIGLRGAQAALALLCLLVYANALHTPFQFDDFIAFADYAGAQGLAGWWAAMPGIRPLLKLSYALNASLSAAPPGYHLVNLALHLGNSLMVFALLQRWPGTPLSLTATFAGAAVFALHPAQTEAVTYLAGRSVSLMASFYLAALLVWSAGESRGRTPAVIALFLLALASKETAATLPAALLLWEMARPRAADDTATHGARLRRALRATAPLWLALCLALLALAALPRYRSLFALSLSLRSPLENLVAQLDGVAYLLTHPLLTLRTNIDPDIAVSTVFTASTLLLAIALLGLIATALAQLRSRPGLALALLWFFLHLAPTNSLLPRLDLANDRQLYLALIGPAWFLAASLQKLALAHRGAAHGAALALILLLGAATIARNRDYRSEVALWSATVRQSPHKARAWTNLGLALRRAGEDAMAAAACQRALAIDPGFEQAQINLGALLLQREAARDTP